MNPLFVSEAQIKIVHNRINNVEDHFGLMCYSFAQVTREDAGLRDSLDDLARTLVAYADKEMLNRTMRTQITHLAEILCGVADIQNDLVQNIEIKVVGGLMGYRKVCKVAHSDIKTLYKAQRKASRSQRLDLTREKPPGNVKQGSLADSKLQRAMFDATRAQTTLGESIQHFEVRKIRDLQRTLLEFCHSELAFHVRCLELYTRAYNEIEEIQIETDLQEFKKAMMFQSVVQDGVNRSTSNVSASQRGRPFGRDVINNSSLSSSSSSQYRQQAPRSHSLDRNYGSRLRVPSQPSYTHRSAMPMSYGQQAGYSGGYGVGFRSSRSFST